MGLFYTPVPPHIGGRQPLEPKKLTPPSAPVVPSFPFPGARIAQAILASWVIAAPAPVVARNLDPPIGAPAATPVFKRQEVAIYNAWAPKPHIAQPNFIADDHAPWASTSIPVYRPIGSRVPAPVLVSWLPPAPRPITAVNLDPPIGVPQVVYYPIGTSVPAAVQVSWLPPVPRPITAVNLDPPISGPTPQNPPVRGTRVPIEVQVSWLPPAPRPITAVLLDPPISAPQVIYVPIGTRIPAAVQVSWLPPVPRPITAINLDPPISGPLPQDPPVLGSRVPAPVQIAWLPPAFRPFVAFKGLPVDGPYVPPQVLFRGTRVSVEVQVSWLPRPTPVQKGASFPLYVPPMELFRGAAIPAALWAWHAPRAPLPQRQVFIRLAASFPFQGARVRQEVLQSWNVQPPRVQFAPPRRIVSGPLPSQPPLGGGARIRQEVLIGWLPPPPEPILGSTGGYIAQAGYTFAPSWRVAVVPAILKVAIVPAIVKVAVVPPIKKTDIPPRGT